MRFPSMILVVAALFGSTVVASGKAPTDCQFKVQPGVPAATSTGPLDVVSRARVLAQPDSPVAITRVDFAGSRLSVAPGFFMWEPRYTLELMNVSDRPVNEVRAGVQLRSGEGSGVGDGGRLKKTLAPGERASIAIRSGPGSGTFTSEDVSLDVFVDAVIFNGCTYRPSQAIPVMTKDRGLSR